MATAPNYYYNSPWIAEAGRNLASALKPPDPDVLRAREQKAWEFEYAKTKAANEATDREHKMFASGKLGEIADIFANPQLDAKGEYDYDAMRAKAASISKEILAVAPEFADEIERVSGPLNPGFIAKERLRSLTEHGQYERLGIRNDFTAGESEKDREFRHNEAEANWAHRFEYLAQQGDQNIEAINARNKAEGKNNAITITRDIGRGIMTGIVQRIRSTGMKLDDSAIYRLFNEIADDTSRNTRNYVTSTDRIWNARFPGGVYRRKRGFLDFGSGDDEYLTPNFSSAIPEFGADTAAPAPAAEQTAAPATDEPRDFSSAMPATPNDRIRANGNREDETAQILLDRQAARTPAAKPTAPRPPSAGKGASARNAGDGKSEASPIPVKAPEDVPKLPKGTWFITPDGRVGQSKGPRK